MKTLIMWVRTLRMIPPFPTITICKLRFGLLLSQRLRFTRRLNYSCEYFSFVLLIWGLMSGKRGPGYIFGWRSLQKVPISMLKSCVWLVRQKGSTETKTNGRSWFGFFWSCYSSVDEPTNRSVFIFPPKPDAIK